MCRIRRETTDLRRRKRINMQFSALKKTDFFPDFRGEFLSGFCEFLLNLSATKKTHCVLGENTVYFA